MRIVVDTNVFVGAVLSRGPANAIVAACLRGRFIPLMGTTLLNEYEDILGRRTLFARSRLNPQEREELLDIFLAACEWTPVYFGWRPNLRDEGDNHLVELAVAGGARCIVTRNLRDLRRMELRFPGLRVLSPNDLLEELTR